MIVASLYFIFTPIFFHKMFDSFGNDSPMMQAQGHQMAAADTPVKRKGGRAEGKNLARGIPQSVIHKFNFSMPDHEIEQQRKRRIQVIQRYWAIRWYKFRSVPEEKWAVQFAFNPSSQYCMQCAPKFNEANREQYRPENPHPTSLLRSARDAPSPR